jgi:membrane-bound metal-dependent hydrolase YbcI (DUF457 family)
MQVGHVAIALSIASYDWNPTTLIIVTTTHFLPNLDVLLIKTGMKDKDFHCTVSHTLSFALMISLLFLPFSMKYALLSFISLVSHYIADLGSTVGQKLFWPLSDKKFTLALWKDTGYWGKSMFIGYYRQPMAWISEVIVFIFLFYRLSIIW